MIVMSTLLILLTLILVTFFLSVALTPRMIRLSHRQGWFAKSNHRTIHQNPTPRLGGVSIAVSFGLVTVIMFLCDPWLGNTLPPVTHTMTFLLLAIGIATTHIVGLLDDFIEFRAVYKGLLQLTGGLLALAAGVLINRIDVPFTNIHIVLGPFGPFVTLAWILGTTNAVNLIDGMDGLAGGISCITLAFIGYWGLMTGHLTQAVAAATGLGAVLGFLVYNAPPARIFMGDSGSLTLGYLIAVLSAWGGDYSLFNQFWMLPVTLVLIPLADTMSAILRRLKANRPIWASDREHTHHKLLDLGFTTGQILAMILGLVVLSSTPMLLAAVGGMSTIWLAVACLISILTVTTAFVTLHFVYRRRFPASAARVATPLERIS